MLKELGQGKQRDSSPMVSVIVLNAFSTDDLTSCLDSLLETEYPSFEVIVVDCQTPGFMLTMKNRFPSVKAIHLVEDIGPSAMHNIGIRESSPISEYFAFLDNDTRVDRTWLRRLVDCGFYDSNIGAVQPKILLMDRPAFLNTKGNLANYLAVGWPDGYGAKDSEADGSREISFPSGACMLLRREALEHIGLFDESYFIYADDLDVGLRMLMAGFTVVYCPTSIAFHKYRFMRSPRSFYYLNRNRIRTYLKLYDRMTYVRLLPAFLIYEVFVAAYAIRIGAAAEYVKGHISNLADRRLILSKRCEMRKVKVLKDQEIISRLKGGIDFKEISTIKAVRSVLNPFLNRYKEMLAVDRHH